MPSPSAEPSEAPLDGEARYYETAVQFHQLCRFGNFVHPEPPYAGLPPDDQPQAAPGATPWVEAQALLGQRSLADALYQRRTRRDFGALPLDVADLRAICSAAYGTRPDPDGERRTVPSVSQLYPLRFTVMAPAVRGLDPALYAFHARRGALEPLEAALPRTLQSWFYTRHVDYGRASAVVLLTGRVDRVGAMYGERGYRYLLLEAGHAAQNLCLAAAALYVPHVPVGGIEEEVVEKALGLDPSRELVLYAVALGQR